MVNTQRYQSILDDYLAQVEKTVSQFEDELARQTAALEEMAKKRGPAGVDEENEGEDKKRSRVQQGDRRTARGPRIFNDE